MADINNPDFDPAFDIDWEDTCDNGRDDMSDRDWDAWEAGPGWNNIDGLAGA